MTSRVETVGEPGRSRPVAALLWVASTAVLVACVLAAFRRGFGDDLLTDWMVNGPRVLFGAGVGALLGFSGALRLARGQDRPMLEMHVLASSTGAAGGGLLAAQLAGPSAAPLAFLFGAAIGAAALNGVVVALDRPRRWTNIFLALSLAAMATIAALAGTYARERDDFIVPLVAWLLGDLSGATFAGAAMIFLGAAVLAAIANSRSKVDEALALVAMSLAVGAAGPLAFVGTLAPRTVRWLMDGAPARLVLPTAMLASAATVAAIDAVPRLLVGGYDFAWNLPAAMLAIPIFLGWNRARLRRLAGSASMAFEIFEVVLIAGMTVGGIALAVLLSRVIGLAT